MLSEKEYRRALTMRYPFWDMLSPAVVKRRIDQLLAAPDCEALIHALPPVEYAVLLKEAPEMRPQLLQLGQPQQIRTVLDLDCWYKDTLQSPRVLAWLEDLQRSGVESFAESACVSEAKARYRLARASAYEIRRNSNGYTVRISATLSRGPAAKITCLTNPSGGVLDMTIEER